MEDYTELQLISDTVPLNSNEMNNEHEQSTTKNKTTMTMGTTTDMDEMEDGTKKESEAKQQQEEKTPLQLFIGSSFAKGGKGQILLNMLLLLLVDIALPMTLFYILEKHIEPIYALIFASTPPLIKIVIFAIWKKRLEVTGILVVFGFSASVVIATLTNNPRLLMLEKSLISLTIAGFFLCTLLPIQFTIFWNSPHQGEKFVLRPLIFYSTKQVFLLGSMQVIDSEGQKTVEDKYEWLWREISSFRRSCRIITAFWGVAMGLEFIGKLFLIYSSLSLDMLVLWSNVFNLSVFALAMVINIFISAHVFKSMKREFDAWFVLHDAKIVQEEQVCIYIGGGVLQQE